NRGWARRACRRSSRLGLGSRTGEEAPSRTVQRVEPSGARPAAPTLGEYQMSNVGCQMAERRSWPGQQRRRGFSLVETMVAAMLLGFAAMVFGAACPTTSQILLRGRNSDLASDACQKQLEFWRDIGYASLPQIPTGVSRVSQAFTPPSALAQATGSVTFTRID